MATALISLAVLLLFVLLYLAIGPLPAKLVERDAGAGAGISGLERAQAVSSVRATLVQAVVGLVAIGAIAVAWNQYKNDRAKAVSERDRFYEELSLTRQGQVAERFTAAIDQLGSNNLELRIGGLYALAGIAEQKSNSKDQAQAQEAQRTRGRIAGVIAAYIREHANWDAEDQKERRVQLLQARFADVQVALLVLDDIFIPGQTRVDLGGVDLRGARFGKGDYLRNADLGGAHLEKTDLSGYRLTNALLCGANLRDATVRNTEFKGAQASPETVGPTANFKWSDRGVKLVKQCRP